MDQVVPWKGLVALIEPHYPKGGGGRPAYPLMAMLRVHLMQNWFGYSDPTMEEKHRSAEFITSLEVFMNYSPLSFSQNTHHELSSLVRDALTELGVPDRLLHDFDSRSTIVIDVDEELSINISLVDDRLFIWSFISMSEELLIDNAWSVMPVITTNMECVETGHLTLGKCNDGFELKALINPLALVENKFSQVINNFYGALKKYPVASERG